MMGAEKEEAAVVEEEKKRSKRCGKNQDGEWWRSTNQRYLTFFHAQNT